MKVSDQIRQSIESAIACGELLPGDTVDDVALTKTYQVSRTPVREALLQLQVQGILISTPRGGSMVAKISLQQLLSLWELLAELEGIAVRLACERMSDDELSLLLKHHQQSKKVVDNDDVKGWQEANFQFHELIYAGARNPFLRQDVLRIRFRTGIYRRHAFGALGQIKSSYQQHEHIVSAVMQRNAASACAYMMDHMRPGRDAKSLNDFIMSLPQELMGIPDPL
ncbi:MAG: GntR family transcriptional regulator [Burkholderiaceae bacterium]